MKKTSAHFEAMRLEKEHCWALFACSHMDGVPDTNGGGVSSTEESADCVG